MLGRVGRGVTALSAAFVASCVPPLDTQDGPTPRLTSIVNHINCELAAIVAARFEPSSRRPHLVPPSNRVIYREASDPKIPALLGALEKYHFVASVSLTLDVADTEGISPFLNFIQPLTSSFNRTLGVGGQLTGSQERNMTFSYSIDMANVSRGCDPLLASAPGVGINGDLGLADIVIDGLEGLGAIQYVNIYGAGGPTRPPFNATVEDLKLGLTCDPGPGPSPTASPSANPSPSASPSPSPSPSANPSASACSPKPLNLSLNGNVNFSPSADPQTPGTVSFAGSAKDDNGVEYLLSPTGSTIGTKSPLKFTLSGTMTREGSKKTDPDIGFSPTINLVGSVVDANDSANLAELCNIFFPPKNGTLKSLCGVTGLLTSSAELSTTKLSFLIGAPIKKAGPNSLKHLFVAAASGGGGAASGSAASKGSISSTSSGTQFGSLVNFMLAYGIEGGPNWTLSTFKGPAGGTGTAGQLLNAGRTHSESAIITFVAACQDNINVEQFASY
jgi:hypothetical protein